MLTKENSLEIKGVDILLMLAFHLFGFPERTPEISTGWIGSPMIKAFQICVPLFLFLGGYGLQCLTVKKFIDGTQLWIRIRKLYIDFWWISIPTIVIGMLIGYYPMNIFKMFMEIFGITSDYNGEWWFFSNYLELFLLFFVFQHLPLNSNKYTLSKAIIMFVILLICSRLIGGYVDWGEYGIFGRHVRMLLVNANIFLLGSIFARYRLFEVVKRRIGHCLDLLGISIFLVVTPILVRAYLPWIGITELVVVPMFCLGVANGMARAWGKILMFLGQHSMNMWLSHTLFIYYYMREITFMAENSIVMYLTVIVCSLMVSIVVGKIKKLTRCIYKLYY